MQYGFDYTNYSEQLVPLFKALEAESEVTATRLNQLLGKYPKDSKQLFRKSELVIAYRALAGTAGLESFHQAMLQKIQMKPTRTISGVTPVTVLTKPFPCPGKCIFCPNDIRMPKSYLSDEPGAQRAERNDFDPYLQTYNRLLAFQNTGHQTEKVELIILGGTWSYYPESYQIWFIKECFRALNDFSEGKDERQQIVGRYKITQQKMLAANKKQNHSKLDQRPSFIPSSDPAQNKKKLQSQLIHGDHLDKSYNQVVSELYVAPEKISGVDQLQQASWEELAVEQKQNETTKSRCVGLVIETRPDNISEAEVLRVRRLGCTKTQIGFQSLNDQVLDKNKRGHNVAATRQAVKLLRQAGFKIHAHWMPNLYGSSPLLDKEDYDRLFSDPDFCPDELKIYPCSLIESAELMKYYKDGQWQPYSEEQLLDVLSYCLVHTPRYCRLTRVIRDIPSTDIVVGNKKTNFREMVEKQIDAVGEQSQNIRAREIRGRKIAAEKLQRKETEYLTSSSKEVFIEFVLPEKINQAEREIDLIAGFLRLSLPTEESFVPELKNCAIIREVHVYGQAVGLGQRAAGQAQHLGLGTRLLIRAKELAAQAGFEQIAVISAVGTREYYRQRGFTDGQLYQSCPTVDGG